MAPTMLGMLLGMSKVKKMVKMAIATELTMMTKTIILILMKQSIKKVTKMAIMMGIHKENPNMRMKKIQKMVYRAYVLL